MGKRKGFQVKLAFPRQQNNLKYNNKKNGVNREKKGTISCSLWVHYVLIWGISMLVNTGRMRRVLFVPDSHCRPSHPVTDEASTHPNLVIFLCV